MIGPAATRRSGTRRPSNERAPAHMIAYAVQSSVLPAQSPMALGSSAGAASSAAAEKVADAPQGERRRPAILHPGEEQQQARRGRNENGHDKQRVQIDDEMWRGDRRHLRPA